jgi:glycosyltransferase involved in cell wall biosynthesis
MSDDYGERQSVLPRITVVVPSFNQAGFLERTLRSVLDQDYPNLELIVMDGGSTDGSVDIIRKYEDRIAHWVSEKDEGQTDALARGFARSTGDIQCWLNSDDLHEPGVLFKVARYFGQHPDADAVFGSTIWIDADDRPLRTHHEMPFNRFIWLHTYNYIPGMSMYWRRAIYEQVGGLDPSFNLAMDADLWSRISRQGRIDHVRDVWSRMRFYPEQKNRALRDASEMEDQKIRLREWGTDSPRFVGAKRLVAMALRVAWKFFIGCYPIGYRRYMEKGEARPEAGA